MAVLFKHNSKIKIKHCNCSESCTRYPTYGLNGRNYLCLSDEEKKEVGTRNAIIRKKKAYDNTQKRMLHIAQKKADEPTVDYAAKLVLWFKYQMQVSEKKCENCGSSLEHYSEDDWFGSQDHIIEKSLCPSIAAHPKNHLVLGKWCCHSQKHTSWLNFSKMPVFEEAKRRYQLFKDDIAENERKKVNPYLLQVHPTNPPTIS